MCSARPAARRPSTRPRSRAMSSMPPTSASRTTSARVDEMLRLAMPEAAIQATPMNNLVLLTGTVALARRRPRSPSTWSQAYVGDGHQVVNRLRTATPLQVTLKVRIAEINRIALKQIGVNLLNRDSDSGFPVRHRPGQSGHDQRRDGSRRSDHRRRRDVTGATSTTSSAARRSASPGHPRARPARHARPRCRRMAW